MYTYEIQKLYYHYDQFYARNFFAHKTNIRSYLSQFCFISSHAAKRKSFLKKFFQTVSELLSSVVGRLEALKKFLTSKDGNLK